VAGQKVKDGVNSLLGGLTKVLTIDAEDLHKPTSPQYSGLPFFDRSKVSLWSASQIHLHLFISYITETSDAEFIYIP